jgi:hypothetical protein
VQVGLGGTSTVAAIVSTAITVAMIEKIQETAPLIILQQIALIK